MRLALMANRQLALHIEFGGDPEYRGRFRIVRTVGIDNIALTLPYPPARAARELGVAPLHQPEASSGVRAVPRR